MIFRHLCSIAVILVALLLTVSCTAKATASYDALVDQSTNPTANHFTSVKSALDAAPANSLQPYKIYIAAGNYYEKLTITKPNIQLLGEGAKTTRIYFDAYAGQTNAEGKIWGTPGSATVTIRTTDIQLHQLTIENSFDFLSNDALATDDAKRVANTQAVALFLDTGSDRVLVRNARLLGNQDTLFVNAGRSWFDKTFIAGNVDYIFGKGNALFTESEIHTLGRGKPNNPHGYLVAPSTQIANEFGLTFIDCKLTRAESVPDNSVPLGRPWHPTTQFADGRYADPNAIGKAVFINTWMAAHITLDGWYSMNGTAKDGTKVPFLPEDSRFFEFNSSGPGAVINNKRRQLSDDEARNYTREKILGDWNP
ncbi:MAG: pectinesterase family protein [Cellvibrio sp.]|uniref:pectinesterase family protein n=1 Tax=Cellvibrio sp. TaxID=1965322 RepID=UPI00271FBD35|nr:pectinesterase family protein [Cellvibrio sp.]